VEGYFDICQRRGLTGEQGVIIPATNVKHLMLRPDVVQAVAEGRFHVYAVNTADQAATLLTGLPAGERDPLSGKYPEGTLNHRIESRLTALARIRTRFTSAESEASVRDSGPGNEAERSVT
jgi:predicted ATP-dependent protease